MEMTQEGIKELQRRIALLEEKNSQAQQKLSWLQEMLSSQKMMFDDVVAYSTHLEIQLSQYQS